MMRPCHRCQCDPESQEPVMFCGGHKAILCLRCNNAVARSILESKEFNRFRIAEARRRAYELACEIDQLDKAVAELNAATVELNNLERELTMPKEGE